ncbi:MAG: deoxyribose-phosphate aldolase [Bacteroidales bacterium]|jgi:deoxyribose-phosphate aldolase|nr:deoxyribose-phosphate aldolase [Bacteroidales bacterium]
MFSFSNYPIPSELQDVEQKVAECAKNAEKYTDDVEVLCKILHSIDLTSLNTEDSKESITSFVQKVNKFSKVYPDIPNVGGICLYPVFSPLYKNFAYLNDVYKAVVVGNFPSSQTFTEIKCAEVKKVIDAGANEVDAVISVGEFLDGNYDYVGDEISKIKNTCGNDARLKVILETSMLESPENIWFASVLAMMAGADMIKTSTGKVSQGGATPEAAYVMCLAIKEYYKQTGKKIGFKPAGGIRSIEDALTYYSIVKNVCGDEWLCPELFRIGASSLANAVLSKILSLKSGQETNIKYFCKD